MIELSTTQFMRWDRINGCEVYKKEDDCYYVKWFTEDGEVTSDAFTGSIAARNYVKSVIDIIKEYEKEVDA